MIAEVRTTADSNELATLLIPMADRQFSAAKCRSCGNHCFH